MVVECEVMVVADILANMIGDRISTIEFHK